MAVSMTPRVKVMLVLAILGGYYYMWGVPEFIMAWFRDKKPEEVYIEAAERGDLETVKRLIGEGVPVDTTASSYELFDNDYKSRARNGDTALIIASKYGHIGMVKYLLKKKAKIDEKNLLSGETALFGAAVFGNVEVVKTLLKNKADPNITDITGRTVLMETCRSGKLKDAEMLKVVQALIDGKANVNATNKRKETALKFCKTSVGARALLEKAGAKE